MNALAGSSWEPLSTLAVEHYCWSSLQPSVLAQSFSVVAQVPLLTFVGHHEIVIGSENLVQFVVPVVAF